MSAPPSGPASGVHFKNLRRNCAHNSELDHVVLSRSRHAALSVTRRTPAAYSADGNPAALFRCQQPFTNGVLTSAAHHGRFWHWPSHSTGGIRSGLLGELLVCRVLLWQRLARLILYGRVSQRRWHAAAESVTISSPPPTSPASAESGQLSGSPVWPSQVNSTLCPGGTGDGAGANQCISGGSTPVYRRNTTVIRQL